jgi:Mg-chelatase subunit ChlD
MFNSFRRNAATTAADDIDTDTETQMSVTENVSHMTMDEESFVHIDDTSANTNTNMMIQPSLTIKAIPRHDTIGRQASMNMNSTQFCVTVTGRELPEEDEGANRAAVDIVVALDVSGSMNGRKLDLCKTTLSLLLRELSSKDRFGLVIFGSNADIAIPARTLTPANKELALAKIQNLRTSGCTNMSGGIGLAAQELQSIENPHDVRALFLLTDGHANVGISTNDGIVSLTKGCLTTPQSDTNISVPAVHCFGYGSDHDADLLRDISQTTEGGSYYFVKDDSDVTSAFGDALGGILSVIAQNTVVTIKVPPSSNTAENIDAGADVSILNIKHDKAVKQTDGSYKVNLGDFYSEESRDIIIETTLSNKIHNGPIPHITASMTYMDTIHKRLAQSNQVNGSIARPEGNGISSTNEHVALQCTRIHTTQIIQEVEALADHGSLNEAKTKITSHIATLQEEEKGSSSKNPLFDQMLSEQNSILEGLESRTAWKSFGSKYAKSRVQTHSMQRCSEPNEATLNSYRSSGKMYRAKKLKTAASHFSKK